MKQLNNKAVIKLGDANALALQSLEVDRQTIRIACFVPDAGVTVTAAPRCMSSTHRSLHVTSSRLPRSTDTAASCTVCHVTRWSARRRALAHLLPACVYVLLLGKPKPRK